METDHEVERRLELGSELAAARQARAAARQVAAEVGADGDDFAIVVSELVSNAVEHGEPPIEVGVRGDGSLYVEVTDRAAGEPRVQPPSTTRVRGRGLALVERLSSRWGVRRALGCKTVWAELDRAGSNDFHGTAPQRRS